MDGYFARLAQRSDVAPANAVPRAPSTRSAQHAGGDGLEQEIEVIVPPLASPDAPAIAIPTAAPDTAPAPSSAEAAPRPTTEVPTESRASDRVALPNGQAHLPHSAATPSRTREAASPQPPMVAAPIMQAAAAPYSASALSAQPAATDSVSIQASTAPARPTAAAFMPPPSHDPWTAENVSAPAPASTTTVAAPAYAMPAQNECATRAEREAHGSDATSTAAIGARVRPRSPAQALEPRAGTQQARAAPQVHIGRIELEVRNRTPTAPAPAPAETVPAPPRSAVFNPHRHYLRGV